MTTMTRTLTSSSLTPPAAKAARTRRLLEGAIVPTLFTLAAPNILNLVALTVIVTADAFFVGWLGATALAGISLVFPLKMLMQHMAASGMGGAVTSAIARSLGAGRRDHANALAVHALVMILHELYFDSLGGDGISGGAIDEALNACQTGTPWSASLLSAASSRSPQTEKSSGSTSIPSLVGHFSPDRQPLRATWSSGRFGTAQRRSPGPRRRPALEYVPSLWIQHATARDRHLVQARGDGAVRCARSAGGRCAGRDVAVSSAADTAAGLVIFALR